VRRTHVLAFHRAKDVIQREVSFVRLAVDELATHVDLLGQCADRVGTANARTPKRLRSFSDSFAAAPADRFMHAPQLKKWTGIIDHHSGIRRLACNRDLNLALSSIQASIE
jgi:hypothetical protein